MEDLNKTCTVKSAESHFMTAIIVVESTAEHYAVRPCSYIGAVQEWVTFTSKYEPCWQ